MKIACLTFTKNGEEVADRILTSHKSNNSLMTQVDIYKNNDIPEGVRGVLSQIVKNYDGIVFICASGIAVRMITPFIRDKRSDPAVVVVDDLGRYSISLLSGHLGGANQLASYIASLIKAQPVITTASDGRGIEAVDMYAKRMGYIIDDMDSAKKLTMMMINGERIGFFSETGGVIHYDNLIFIHSLSEVNRLENEVEGFVCVTSLKDINCDMQSCILRPKDLNIGIGCRRGVKAEGIIKAISTVLLENNLSEKCIKNIATAEIKKDEEGIIKACKYFNCHMKVYSLEEIKRVEDRFLKSDFVREKIGVSSVCEPCSYLSGGEVIVGKTKLNGITVAVSKEDQYYD